ncbi:MAG: biopolymer transporter ExbD [Planctomycetes bacterium]|nr:biopolymer transporter ExbD [Planctomycetota bacterium]
MRLPRFGRSRSVDFNVTPLIDVVFLLIIFFLVSSHLAQQETQLELTLPSASSSREQDAQPVPRVTINVLANGQLLLGSKEVVPQEISRRLQVERRETTQDLEVRIRADRNIAYRHIEPLLLACAEAHVWNVSFAVVERSGPSALSHRQ